MRSSSWSLKDNSKSKTMGFFGFYVKKFNILLFFVVYREQKYKKNQADGKKRYKFCKKMQKFRPFLPPLILALDIYPPCFARWINAYELASITTKENLMATISADEKVVANALSLAGHASANDITFVSRLTSVLNSTKSIYEENKGADWVRASTFVAKQGARSARFIKLGASASPARASVAILAVMGEKVALVAGFSADDERLKCGAALTALAGNTAAMLVLGAGTGGLAIGLTVLSLSASLMEVNNQCKTLSEE